MTKRYEKARNELNEAEQDAEELERQASDTGTKLVRARSELRQLQEQVKESEGRKIQLDDQCRQLARVSREQQCNMWVAGCGNEAAIQDVHQLFLY